MFPCRPFSKTFSHLPPVLTAGKCGERARASLLPRDREESVSIRGQGAVDPLVSYSPLPPLSPLLHRLYPPDSPVSSLISSPSQLFFSLVWFSLHAPTLFPGYVFFPGHSPDFPRARGLTNDDCVPQRPQHRIPTRNPAGNAADHQGTGERHHDSTGTLIPSVPLRLFPPCSCLSLLLCRCRLVLPSSSPSP